MSDWITWESWQRPRRQIGVAEYLDRQQPDLQRQVSMGTATVAMILNGLGESLRRLYLVPQFFEHKPVEHLLGAGIQFEGIDLLHVWTAAGRTCLVLHLQSFHQQVLRLLGPPYVNFSKLSRFLCAMWGGCGQDD